MRIKLDENLPSTLTEGVNFEAHLGTHARSE